MNIEEIYERQHARVYRVAMLFLKNVAEAEDATQNVFLKVMEKQPEFESQNHEDAWFITVTRNYCKDVVKAFWKKNVDMGDILDNVPERTTEVSDAAKEVLEQVLLLPPKYREVVYLYYYEGYSVREMSLMLGRKESTLQTQLADARKKLRVAIEEGGAAHG